MNSILRACHYLVLRAPIEIDLVILIPCIKKLKKITSDPYTPDHLSITALTKMPEPIPLRAALRVERQRVVVDRPRRLVEDMLMKRLPVETRHFRPI